MKTYSCKIDNRWLWSLEQACIGITSPSGRTAWIRKLDADLPSEEDWAVIKEKILDVPDGSSVALSVAEMEAVARMAKQAGRVVEKVVSKPVAVQQPVTKSKPQKSYAARKFDRIASMHANYNSIIGGCCPSCGSRSLKVKDHGSWVGYFCKPCGAGGSVSRTNKRY